jgi:hypothetical protein
MHRVGHYGFAVGFYCDGEFDGLRVGLARGGGLLGQLPVVAAVEVLDKSNAGGFFLVVADSDFKGLVHPVLTGFDVVVGALALADDVEGVASVEAQGFVLGSVIDRIFADELKVPVGIASVETQAAFGKRDAKMVGLRVLELLHHKNFRIGLRAIGRILADLVGIVVPVLGKLRAIVDVEALRTDPVCAYEFYLLGFLIVQSG